jgi:pyruvate dehydrogenase E1 component beta subunit
LDSGFTTGSVAGEIVARVAIEVFSSLNSPPSKLAMPDVPEPTSYALTKSFYIRSKNIAEKVMMMMDRDSSSIGDLLIEPEPHDVPGKWFKGPF